MNIDAVSVSDIVLLLLPVILMVVEMTFEMAAALLWFELQIEFSWFAALSQCLFYAPIPKILLRPSSLEVMNKIFSRRRKSFFFWPGATLYSQSW